jgi:septum formation protein
MRLAKQKAADVAGRIEEGIVIGCDTVVECDRRILGKPQDRADADNMLRLLRGKIQHVYSGLCLWRRPGDRVRTEIDVTKLKMEAITDHQLKEYLDSNAWQGKAGAFGYQDRHGWIRIVAGSESNVVGLPLELLAKMLSQFTKG